MIGYYVHHQGHGHARRALAVARHLRHEVTGLGSGPRPQGWPGSWQALDRDDTPAPDPATADLTAHGVLHWAPRHHAGLLARHAQIVTWLTQARPLLVVVDVSVEVSLLVRLCGVPVVLGGMPGERTDRAHTLAHDLAEAILAPWPAGAHPGSGWPQRWWDKTWEVGGISALADTPAPRGDGAPRSSAGGDRDVLVLWGAGGDGVDEDDLAGAREQTPGWRWTLRSGADTAGLRQDLTAADVVVAHAGQGAVADLALTRRPAVVVGQPRPHGEQEATLAALERLDLAETSRGWPGPQEWPQLLDRALRRGGQGWSRWGGDGGARAAARLDALARGLAT